MGKESLRVLHIDTVKNWRGGQQQAAYLIQALHKAGYLTALVCQPHSALHQFCEEQTLPHFPVKMLGEGDVIAGGKIASIARKYHFDILHAHSAHALAIGILAKLLYPKVKLIAVRRVDFHIKKNFFSRFKYKTRLLDKIICISNSIKNVLETDGISPEKLLTIHSGIDIHKFNNVVPPPDVNKKLGVPDDHLIVGTIAAMAGHKDYPNLLHAAKIVLEQNTRITFCAVGDGPLEKEIRALAVKLHVGKRFVFPGYRTDIGNFLKIFDIFVLASKKEGLGTSLLDAQANGLPIVACNTGGIPEAVTHNENGLLVPPRDERALAAAIMKLISDEQLRKKLGQNALQSVKKFDIRFTIEKNINLYENLVSE